MHSRRGHCQKSYVFFKSEMLGPRVCTQIPKVKATNLCASDWHLLIALVHVCGKRTWLFRACKYSTLRTVLPLHMVHIISMNKSSIYVQRLFS